MPHTIAFYKPFEVLSQFTDTSGRATLKDFINIPGIYPAGRLDYRSEGLLILSDDGLFIQRLADPRFEHPKVYYAQVEGVPQAHELEVLSQRILLPGTQTRLVEAHIIPPPDIPPRPKAVRQYHPTTWLRLVLSEGKKHEVRRLTAALGYPTLRLVRFAIGPVTIQGLRPGAWRMLTNTEILIINGIKLAHD